MTFWQDLTETERDAFGAVAGHRTFAPGEALCLQGAAAGQVLVILDGWVKVTVHTSEGQEVLLAVRGKGDLVGESGWLHSRPRSANVYPLGAVRTLVTPSAQFAAFLDGYPHAAQIMARMMVDRLDDADRRMAAQATSDGPTRLAAMLVELGDRYGLPTPEHGIVLTMPLTQQELATSIGGARETVARALTTWRRGGIVSTGRKRITILDPPALRAIAAHTG